MVTVTPSGKSLGARITDIDLAQPLGERTFAILLGALAHYGILCGTMTLRPASSSSRISCRALPDGDRFHGLRREDGGTGA